MQAETTLTNASELNLNGAGDIHIFANAVLNNSPSATISIIGRGAAVERISGNTLIANEGLIVDSAGGTNTISSATQNTGIIQATSGILDFSNILNNDAGGTLTGTATIGIPSGSNFTNNGIVAPGLSVGSLTILGDYKSTANTTLEIEINGLTPVTEHDVLEITGTNVVFEGSVAIILGFEPSIGDTFTIANTSGSITSQNLISPVNAISNGNNYTFEVSYPGNNSVMLTVTDSTLDLEEVPSDETRITIFPNPFDDQLNLKSNSSTNLESMGIYDMSGKRIFETALDAHSVTKTIKLPDFSKGLYFIRITSSKGEMVRQLIKN